MLTRNIVEVDYYQVIDVVDDWWGGRPMTHLLPRLFFEHFQSTSFVVENDEVLSAFLIGFISQSRSGEAYIHFVGVHPELRKSGLAKQLYERFFMVVRDMGCNRVITTSPRNLSLNRPDIPRMKGGMVANTLALLPISPRTQNILKRNLASTRIKSQLV